MRYIKYIFICLVSLSGLSSCLFENDMSYPRVPAEITSFAVEGQVSVSIDASNRIVSVVLGETVEMSKAKVSAFQISPTATLVGEVPEYLDLTKPVEFVLNAWYDYKWTVTATQPIDRHITVGNQIGETSIDLARRYAEVYVTESQSLDKVLFEDVKLEPEGSVVVSSTGYVLDGEVEKEVTDECDFPMTLSCVNLRKFTVRYKGEEIVWSVKVLQQHVALQVSGVNPWCHHAEVIARFDGTGTPAVEYRKASASSWKTAPAVTVSGLDLSVELSGLQENTDYEVRLNNGGEYSDVVAFRTESPLQLPNMSFDDWYQGDPNNTWYPEPRNEKVWDTANKGLNMFNEQNPSTPVSDFVAVPGEGKKAVRLKSMTLLGMFGAGNIITGNFQKAVITPSIGAELTWGTAFTGRPQALVGYYAYSPREIDMCSDRHKDKIGTMDKLQLLFMLTDWDEPFQVKTATETYVDQVNDPHIIAHGTIESDEDTHGEYVRFRCPLIYRDTWRKPTHAVVIACSSLYGDYFTGGIGTTLWVDEFEFEYD